MLAVINCCGDNRRNLTLEDTVQQKYVHCTLSLISIEHNLTLMMSQTDQSSSSISWTLEKTTAAVVVVVVVAEVVG